MRDAKLAATGGIARTRTVADAPRWLGYCLILGLYLTLRGYHSLDGDQAYRLPILLHQQDPTLFAGDPFIRAFDVFNPHRGSQATIGLLTGWAGLSAGLLLLFVVTFLATCLGIDRLARAVWPALSSRVGWTTIALVLAAKAGNIGTNHLFEAMVLDRLMAMAAGWLVVAAVVSEPGRARWIPAVGLGLATWIHPSLGLQLALVVAGSWLFWAVAGLWTGVSWHQAAEGIVIASLAVIPGLVVNLAPGASLHEGLPPADFWTLAVELQSPQHMLPHLWRLPQWLAWGCYLILALLALVGRRQATFRRAEQGAPMDGVDPGRGPCVVLIRLTIMLIVVLLGLAGAWAAIEGLHHVRVTVFQPFRMATLARGLALVLVAGRVLDLWDRGTWLARVRAILIGVGLTGDWLLVIVTLIELATAVAEGLTRQATVVAFASTTAWGVYFLSRHDTESGHWPLFMVLCAAAAWAGFRSWSSGKPRALDAWREALRLRWVMPLAWTVPALALVAGAIPVGHRASRTSLVRGLVARCRFAPVPIDDIERLALWCRRHTPVSARFVGPPGPKTFRLWSRRSLAFNRAGSPYHAAGLADWFARFQDHVDVHAPPAAFVRDYAAGRHQLEARFDRLSPAQMAALAFRQGADHVIAGAPGTRPVDGPLEILHVEGRYAVYRVRPDRLSQGDR